METGKLIKELRVKKGMTQEELAEKTEVSSRTIQRIENGEVDPRAYTLQMIAKALEVDFNLFVDNEALEEEVQEANVKSWLGLLHLSGILPLIFPTILIWNQKKAKTKDMTIHFRGVISFQLCVIGISLGGLWAYWWTNMLIPFVGALLMGGLVSIVNAIMVMNGNPFINPFIKQG